MKDPGCLTVCVRDGLLKRQPQSATKPPYIGKVFGFIAP